MIQLLCLSLFFLQFTYIFQQTCDSSCVCSNPLLGWLCISCNTPYLFIIQNINNTSKCVENRADLENYYLDSNEIYQECNCDRGCLFHENLTSPNTSISICNLSFEEYYQLELQDKNDPPNIIIYFYSQIPNKYYSIEKKLFSCFVLCETCSSSGTEQINNCTTCISNYLSIVDQPGQCILNNSDYPGYHNDTNGTKVFQKCYNKCYRCIGNGTYAEQNCKSCQSNDFFIEKSNEKEQGSIGNCIETKIISEGKLIEDINIFFPNNRSDFKETIIPSGLYIYSIHSYKKQSDLNNYIPQFDLSNSFEAIKELFSSQSLDDIIIAQSLKNTTNIATTKSNFILYKEDGIKLDLKLLANKNASFNIVVPLHVNKTYISYDYAKELFSLGIDIYNPKDALYNSLCYPFEKDGKDLSLVQRRGIIFPNVTLCQPGCVNQNIIFENYTINCKCYFDNSLKFIPTFDDGNESSNNFGLFACFSIYKTLTTSNIMLIIAISFLSIQVAITIMIIITYRKRIDYHLKKILINPPKRSGEVEPLHFYDNEDEDKSSKDNYKKEVKSIMISSDNSFNINKNNDEEDTSQYVENLSEDTVDKNQPKAKGKSKAARKKQVRKQIDSEFDKHESNEEEKEEEEEDDDKTVVKDKPSNRNDYKNESNNNHFGEIPSSNRNFNNDPNSSDRNNNFDKTTFLHQTSTKQHQRNKVINPLNTNNNQQTITPKNGSSIINNSSLSFSSSIGFEANWRELPFEEYNISPLNTLLHCEKNNQIRYWKYFCCIFFERQIVFALFNTKNMFYPIALRLFVFVYNIISIIFFNSLLYSPAYFTKRFKASENLTFGYIIVNEWMKSFYASLIIVLTSKIYYLLTYCNVLYFRINEKDQVKNSKIIFTLLKRYRIKVIILILVLFIIMIGFLYFVIIFCALYPNNFVALIHSSILSLLFYFPIQAVLCILIGFIRFVGIDNELK